MSHTFVLFAVVFASGLGGFIGGIAVGRPLGVAAERLRVERIFDVALSFITSGALWKVRRRIRGEYNDHTMQAALVREVEYREKERRRRAG